MNTSNDPLAAIRDAIAALPDKHAAPLAEALDTFTALAAAARRLEVAANTVGYCYTKRPENFAAALRDMKDDAEAVRTILANFPESK